MPNEKMRANWRRNWEGTAAAATTKISQLCQTVPRERRPAMGGARSSRIYVHSTGRANKITCCALTDLPRVLSFAILPHPTLKPARRCRTRGHFQIAALAARLQSPVNTEVNSERHTPGAYYSTSNPSSIFQCCLKLSNQPALRPPVQAGWMVQPPPGLRPAKK